jgi:hypothetical protein
MRLHGRVLSLDEDLASFKKEVTDEIGSEEKLLQKLEEPVRGQIIFHVVSIALIVLMGVWITMENSIFFTWMIVGILLYSYNWLIFFIPTSTESIRPEDADYVPQIVKERRWYVIRLLIKERKLAMEMALTLFLGGILPVALSFTVIFGLAVFFGVYFGFFTHFLDGGTANFILIQIALILLFYVMMLIIRPQAQGVTRIGRYFRDKIKIAKSKGAGALAALVLIIAALSLVASILVFGAIMLPGFLISILWSDVNFLAISNIPVIAAVFISQLVIMRHFQGTVSRRLARTRYRERLQVLNTEVYIKLDELSQLPDDLGKKFMLDDLKGKFYSIAIYDLIDQDIFGYSRIYLFGVRIRFVLDEDVILYITTMTKRVLRAKKKEMPSTPGKDTAADHPGADASHGKGSAKTVSGFDKQGAPCLDPDSCRGETGNQKQSLAASSNPDPSGGSLNVKASKEPGAGKMEEKLTSLKESKEAGAKKVEERPTSLKASKEPGAGKVEEKLASLKASEGPTPNGKGQQINLNLVEMASYTILKTAFKDGVAFPIKREGVVDMDVAVEGKEITINTNQLYFSFPELTVWHIVYTHKNKPILEIGRGVKNGMKVHRLNAIRLGLEAWNGTRKQNKEKKRQAIESEREAHQKALE